MFRKREIELRRKSFLFILVISLIFSLFLQSKKKPKLPPKYKKWIKEEAVYIISPKERKVFYELETDREREQFIEEFWRHRDPTPGTPRNEFREEHYRRIEYANKKLGRGTATRGWATDQGRIYIILGEPMQIVRISTVDINPVEIWYYQGNPRLRLPSIFRILFFKRQGVGAYELYNPISDGPRVLVPASDLRMPGNPDAMYQTRVDWRDLVAYEILQRQVSIELAEAAWSAFPGRDGPDHSLPSVMLIDELASHPYKKVDDDYAYEFLEHKAVVEVSYSVYYMNNHSQVKVIQDTSDQFFINYSIEPEKLSVDFFQGKYLANIKISVRVTDLEGKTIFQHSRNFPIELDKKQLKKIGQRPFHLCDSIPMIPGSYKFNLLFENTVTKEFTSFEKDISVPEPEFLQMSPLILATKVNQDSPYSEFNKAFQIGSLQLYPSPRNNFFNKEKLFLFFQVYGLILELERNGTLEFTFYKGEQEIHTLTKEIKEYKKRRGFIQDFPLDKFSPGKYWVKVSLFNEEGREVLFEKEDFTVSSKVLPESWIVSQTNPSLKDPVYFYLLGNQYFNKGEVSKARYELEKAYQQEPETMDFALSYARALLILKEFQTVKEILLPYSEAGKQGFQLYYYLGLSSQAESKMEEAISFYQKALSHKGNVKQVLNSIGECFFQLGDKEQALRAWQKSLEIDSEQVKVKRMIETLQEEK